MQAMCLSVHLFLSAQFKTGHLILICPYLKYFMDFNKKRKTSFQYQLATEYPNYIALVLPVQFLPASQIKDHKCAVDSTFNIEIYKIFHIRAKIKSN